MIPISYNKAVNSSYEDYTAKFRKDIDRWIYHGYVGNKKSDGSIPFPLNDDSKDFFRYLANLMDKSLFWDMNTDELRNFRSSVEAHIIFRQILDHNSTFYKAVKHAFVSIGYTKNLDKGAFIEAVGADVCPYCNRTFIKNIKTKNGEIKGELDHFINKEKAPYLALCRYNLVPSCPFCNHGKLNADNADLVNPYDLADCNGIHFQMKITGKGFTSLDDCASAITITAENKSNMDANIKDFHLAKIYNEHKDYAAEVYYKGRLRWNPIYKFWLHRVASRLKGCSMTEGDLQRYILGVYTNPKDFNKRPLSKFICDLALDANIIE